MSTSTLLLFVCAGLCLHLHLTRALLNLDPLSPTVVASSSSSMEGFGWTLTQHVFGDGSKGVLVSAPFANGNISREGGVYSCPFDVQGACRFEPQFHYKKFTADDPFELTEDPDLRTYEGQLLGYSLKSSGSSVMVCAPLAVFSITQRGGVESGFPNGRCIILNSNLSSPVPVFRGDLSELQLAGLDLEFFRSGGGEEGFVLSNTFFGQDPRRGQLILSRRVTEGNIQSDEVSSAPNDPAVPILPLTGFHLEQGFFTQLQTPEIVSSSPRAFNHRGQIEIFNTISLGRLVSYFGQESDGYFGYDFAVLDLGHENYNSLAVGCPLCSRERGSVYIYLPTKNPSDPLRLATILLSPSTTRGRFGLAVENIGDIDQDGLSDLAVSAPYEGSGVIYIYRGTETGVLQEDYQRIPAVDGTTAFGYSLSGGLDIDNNGYPDLSVGDLGGGRVTTIRSNPVVRVSIEVQDQKEVLNITGGTDRRCLLEGIVLHCFDVVPCFYYEEIQNSTANFEEIAVEYTVLVDRVRSRFISYSVGPGGEVTTGEPEVTKVVRISGPGRDNMACDAPLTFALDADFVELGSIPVVVSVNDAPELLPLGPEPGTEIFGGPLHPVIQRYIRGNVPANLSFEYNISSNLDCSFGDPNICEGSFELDVSDLTDQSDMLNGNVLLASSNEFGYLVNVTNVAEDSAVSPILIVQLPKQIRLSGTEPSSICNTRTDATPTNSSIIECALKNPTNSNETVTIEMYFAFNDTRALLEVSQLELSFSVRDGGTQQVSTPIPRTIMLEAVSEYFLSTRVDRLQYRALRSAVIFPDPSIIPLELLGPQLTLSVLVQNNRGSIFSRSTLYIYLPMELLGSEEGEGEGEGEEEEGRILLIPFQVVVSSRDVNCSHYQAIHEELPEIQQPTNFLSSWTGAPPPTSPECSQNGAVRCGTIICTILDLQPSPQPPTDITVQARLYSPSIGSDSERVQIFTQIESNTERPLLGGNNVNRSEASFMVSPGVGEVQRDCIRYWVVVVSVVVGIAALLIIIIFLAACGVFRRWYKFRQEDLADGDEQTDNELTYQRRTIPPLAFNGAPSTSPPPEASNGWGADVGKGMSDKELEKDKEAEMEFSAMFDKPSKSSPAKLDPNDVLEDSDFEGLETDL